MSWDDTYLGGRHLLAVLSDGILTICDLGRRVAVQSFDGLPDSGIVRWSASSEHLCVYSASGLYVLHPNMAMRESAGVVLRWREPDLSNAIHPDAPWLEMDLAYPYLAFTTAEEVYIIDLVAEERRMESPRRDASAGDSYKVTHLLRTPLNGENALVSFSASRNLVAVSAGRCTNVYLLPQASISAASATVLKLFASTTHSEAVARLLWRSEGYEYRELLLVTMVDACAAVYSFIQEHTQGDLSRVAHLVTELADFAGSPCAITWLRHEPVPSVDNSPHRLVVPAAADSTERSDDLTEPGNPDSIGGAWLMGVGVDRVARLWCLHPGSTGDLTCRSIACGLLCTNIVGVDTTDLLIHEDQPATVAHTNLVQLRNLRATGYFHLNGSGRPIRITSICEGHLFERETTSNSSALSFIDRSYPVIPTSPEAKKSVAVQLLVSGLNCKNIPDRNCVLLEENEIFQLGVLRNALHRRVCMTHLPELTFCSGPYPALVFDAWSPEHDRSVVSLQPRVLPSLEQSARWSNTLMHITMCAGDAIENKHEEYTSDDAPNEKSRSPVVYSGHTVCRSLAFNHPSMIKIISSGMRAQPSLEFKWISFSQGASDAARIGEEISGPPNPDEHPSLFHDSIGLLHVAGTLHVLCLILADQAIQQEAVRIPPKYIQSIQSSATDATNQFSLPQGFGDDEWIDYDDFQQGEHEVVVVPDKIQGLGLRLKLVGPDIVIENFKRHPLTGDPLPAEATGAIHSGDQLLAINGNSVEGGTLENAVQLIRSLVASARGGQMTLRVKKSNSKLRESRMSGIVNARWFLESGLGQAGPAAAPVVFKLERPRYWSSLGTIKQSNPIICYDVKPLGGEMISCSRLLAVTIQQVEHRYKLFLHPVSVTPFLATTTPTRYSFDEAPTDIQLQLLGEFHARIYVCMRGGMVHVYTVRVEDGPLHCVETASIASHQLSDHSLHGTKPATQDRIFLGSYISSSARPEMFHLHADSFRNELIVERVGVDLPASQQVVSTLNTKFHGFPSWCSTNADTLIVGGYSHIVSWLLSNGTYTTSVECASGPFSAPPFMYSELINSAVKAPSPWSSFGLKSEPITKYHGGIPDWHPLHLCTVLLHQTEQQAGTGVSRCLAVLHKLGQLLEDYIDETLLNDTFPIVLDTGSYQTSRPKHADSNTQTVEQVSEARMLDTVNCVRKAVEPIAVLFFSVGGVQSALDVQVRKLPQPLRVLSVPSLCVLYAMVTALLDYIVPMTKGAAAGYPDWTDLDTAARHTIKGYIIANELYRLRTRNTLSSDDVQCIPMPATLSLASTISRTQAELLQALLTYVRAVRAQSSTPEPELDEYVPDEQDSNEMPDTPNKPNQPKKKIPPPSLLFREFSILSVAYWYRDLAGLKQLIEEDAAATLKKGVYTMHVLCHYIFIGKRAKLTQLARTDSSTAGFQLQKLLSYDFESPRGRAAAQKNGFALMRKQQYLDAAAVFLLADPPLLRDATRVLENNMSDPSLALLVARLLEPDTLDVRRGAVLGPRALEIVGDLQHPPRVVNRAQSDVDALLVGQDNLWAPVAAKLLIAMWSQDAKQVDTAAAALADCITSVSNLTTDASVSKLSDLLQLMTAEMIAYPLGHITTQLTVREATLKNMARLLQSKGISTDLVRMIPSILRRDTDSTTELDPFRAYCCEVALQQESSFGVPEFAKQTSTPSSMMDTPRLQASNSFNLSSMSPTLSDPSPTVATPAKSGMFNFAKAAPQSSGPDIFGDFGYTPPPAQTNASNNGGDIFGDFGYTPPAAQQQPTPQANDIFASFDYPSVSSTPQKSIFDDFEPAPSVKQQQVSAIDKPTLSPQVRAFCRLDGSVQAEDEINSATIVDALSTIGYDIRQRCLQELIYVLRVIDNKHPYMIRADVHGLLHLVIEHAAFHEGPKIFIESFESSIRDLATRFQDYLIFLQAKSGEVKDCTSDQIVLWLCEDLLWWLGETGRRTYPLIAACLYNYLGHTAQSEEVILASSVKLLHAFQPGFMDTLNGAGEATELGFLTLRMHSLSIASQVQTAVILQLGGYFAFHTSTMDLASAAVRGALLLGAIGREYDVVQKILKHFPVKAAAPMPTKSNDETARSIEWRYIRHVTRPQAEEMLNGKKSGTFLLRPIESGIPHPTYGLSFSIVTEVRHAIIRVESNSDGSVAFKCGRLGPLPSLHDLLLNISTVVSCGLSFDPADIPPTLEGSPLPNEPSALSTLEIGREEPSLGQVWSQLDPNKPLWTSLGRLMTYSLKQKRDLNASRERIVQHSSSTSPVDDDHYIMFDEETLSRPILSITLRTVLHLLVLKSFYKQLLGAFLSPFPETVRSLVLGMVADAGIWPSGTSRFEQSTTARPDVPTMALSSLRRMIQTTEIAVFQGLCPRLQPMPPALDEINAYETYLHELLNPRTGVTTRYVPVKSADEQGREQDLWMLCFTADDAAEWMVANKKLPTVDEAQHMLQASYDARLLQRVNVNGSDRVQYHYLNQWEVSVVQDVLQAGVRLGRHWYGPVRAFGASHVITDVVGEWQLGPAGHIRPNISDVVSWKRPCPYWSDSILESAIAGAPKLWDSLRGEGWLVSTLTTAYTPEDRDWGIVEKSERLSKMGQDTFQKCVALYCYRNVLLQRLYLPHRFVAFVEVELQELKNLAPNFRPHPMDVVACVGLSHDTFQDSRKLQPRPGATDFVTTPEKKLWALPASPARYPQAAAPPTSPVVGVPETTSHVWREQALLKFPLPDQISRNDVGPTFDKPPQALHISVFERKGFFGDQRLGDAVIELTELSDTIPYVKFVGLTQDNNAHTPWFIRVQVTVRFTLMAIDLEKEQEARAVRLTTKRRRKLPTPHFHRRQGTRRSMTLEIYERGNAIFRRQTLRPESSARKNRPEEAKAAEEVKQDKQERPSRSSIRHNLLTRRPPMIAEDAAKQPARPEKIGTTKVPLASAMANNF